MFVFLLKVLSFVRVGVCPFPPFYFLFKPWHWQNADYYQVFIVAYVNISPFQGNELKKQPSLLTWYRLLKMPLVIAASLSLVTGTCIVAAFFSCFLCPCCFVCLCLGVFEQIHRAQSCRRRCSSHLGCQVVLCCTPRTKTMAAPGSVKSSCSVIAVPACLHAVGGWKLSQCGTTSTLVSTM